VAIKLLATPKHNLTKRIKGSFHKLPFLFMGRTCGTVARMTRTPLWSQSWFIWLLRCASFVLVTAVLVGTLLNGLGALPQGIDFLQFHAAAQSRMLHGGSLYQPFVYIPESHLYIFLGEQLPGRVNENLNPPVVSLLFLPLAHLDQRSAYYLFVLPQFLLALFVWRRFITHMFGTHPALKPAATLALAGFFPVMAGMMIGQVGLLLFTLLLLGWMALEKGNDRQAALWLGLALLLKLFVGLVFIWLALSRRWRVLFGASALYVAGMALTLAYFGLEEHKAWLQAVKAMPFVAMTWNASLDGLIYRYLGGGPVMAIFNMPILAFFIRSMAIVVTAMLLIWLARRPHSFALGFALCLPLMLLLTPLGWIYYFPALLLAGCLLWRETGVTRHKVWLAISLALCGVPQLPSGRDFYTPSLWRGYDKGGYSTVVDGHTEIVRYGVYYWIDVPELFTLGLIVLSVTGFVIARPKTASATA